MKSFLECWLAEAPKAFHSKFAGEFNLLPSARLPQPEAAVSFAISFATSPGRFLVSAEQTSLQALIAAHGFIADDEGNTDHLETWRTMLQEIAESACRLFHPEAASCAISIDPARWTLGKPSAAYELHCGANVALLAFTDEIEKPGLEPRQAQATSVASSANPTKIVPGGIDLLMDVELEASIRFGSREMPLNEVLDLGAGDVLELDRHVTDPVDLLVGDKIVARGEVVLVNGSFGLRVLEVAEPKKCLESIRCLF